MPDKMAALRAFLILCAVLAFFLVGAPLQWIIATRAPGRAGAIPRLFCRALLALVRVRVATSGALVEGQPVLAVANHVSWIDILALGAIEPFCFLAKSDVAAWPIVSAFSEVQGTVFVDRARRRSIIPANAALAARMLEGRRALLFPEGTTFAGPEPGPFKSSHLAAARDLLALSPAHRSVSIQPIALRYSSASAAWIGDDALLPHLWRILRGPPLICEVAFGAPIAYPRGTDRKMVAGAARHAVVALLDARSTSTATADRFCDDGLAATAVGGV